MGVDPRIEFVDTDFDTPPTQPRHPLHSVPAEVVDHRARRGDPHSHTLGLADPGLEAQRVAQRLEAHLRSTLALQSVERAEMIDAVFYRGQSAHLIGRLFSGSHLVPFVMVVSILPAARWLTPCCSPRTR